MLSPQDRERIREEEAMVNDIRMEHRRQHRPRLLAITVAWTFLLTALAFLSTHLHG